MSAIRFTTIAKSRVATAPRFIAARSISSTPNYQKSAVDVGKDALKKTNEIAAKAAIKGIDAGEKAAGKIKETVGSKSEIKGKANEAAGEMKGKAHEAAGKAHEVAGEAKGKAKEIKKEHL